MENKLKHLEFIQNTIMRLNTNSFQIKGWSVGILTGLFALAAGGANVKYIIVAYLIIPVFWFLDAHFLSSERKYRKLYNEVTKNSENVVNFQMEISTFKDKSTSLLNTLFSVTIILFYSISFIITTILMYYLK